MMSHRPSSPDQPSDTDAGHTGGGPDDSPNSAETAAKATAGSRSTARPCGTVRRGRPSVAEAEQLYGKILDASWDVLLEVGFEAFTFDRVARHARIGKATIYSRFAGKRELFEALLHHGIAKRKQFLDAQGEHLPVADAFRLRATEAMELLFSPDGKLMERLIDVLDNEAGSAQGGYRAYVYRSAVEQIRGHLERAQQRGEILVGDCQAAARFWLEGVIGHYKMASSEGGQTRARHDDWAERYLAFFLSGIRAAGSPGGPLG